MTPNFERLLDKATLDQCPPIVWSASNCQEYATNKPQASRIVEDSRCCYRGALHARTSWGLTLDAKEVHTIFLLSPKNQPLAIRGTLEGPWRGDHTSWTMV